MVFHVGTTHAPTRMRLCTRTHLGEGAIYALGADIIFQGKTEFTNNNANDNGGETNY